MHPIPLKIAFIGGGSREWARKLMIALALCPDLTHCLPIDTVWEFFNRLLELNQNYRPAMTAALSGGQYQR